MKNEKAPPILPNLSFVGYEGWISFTVFVVYSFFQEQILHKTNDSMNVIQKVIFLAGSWRTSSKKDIVCWVMTMTVMVKALRGEDRYQPRKGCSIDSTFGGGKKKKRKKFQILVLWRHNHLKDYVFDMNTTNSVFHRYVMHHRTELREGSWLCCSIPHLCLLSDQNLFISNSVVTPKPCAPRKTNNLGWPRTVVTVGLVSPGDIMTPKGPEL